MQNYLIGYTIEVVNLIVEAFTIYAASALAAGVFLRSMVATFLPLVGPTLNEKVGYGW
jgi:hypothetical protein